MPAVNANTEIPKTAVWAAQQLDKIVKTLGVTGWRAQIVLELLVELYVMRAEFRPVLWERIRSWLPTGDVTIMQACALGHQINDFRAMIRREA